MRARIAAMLAALCLIGGNIAIASPAEAAAPCRSNACMPIGKSKPKPPPGCYPVGSVFVCPY